MSCCHFTRPQVHGHCVRLGRGAGVRDPGWREDRAGLPRVPPSGLSEAQGPLAIWEETKRLFPLIWFYRDLMLTLNFECFYLFQSLIPILGGGSRAHAANNLLERDSGTGMGRPEAPWKLQGAGATLVAAPTYMHMQLPRARRHPFPARSCARKLSAKPAAPEAGARHGRPWPWRRDPGSGGARRGDATDLAAAAATRFSLRSPHTHAKRLNYFQVWTT